MTLLVQKVRKITLEYSDKDINDLVLEFTEPPYARLEGFEPEYSYYSDRAIRITDPQYQLTWTGPGRITKTRKPVDIDDNPCIVRGSE